VSSEDVTAGIGKSAASIQSSRRMRESIFQEVVPSEEITVKKLAKKVYFPCDLSLFEQGKMFGINNLPVLASKHHDLTAEL
jgi:hypothetical protein